MNTIDLFKLVLNIFEIAACIIGFLYIQKLKSSHWKFFPYYLLLIVLSEFTGKYFHYAGLNNVKVGLYNYFVIPLEILFFIWLFYKEFKHSAARLLPVAAACIYIAGWLADMFAITKNPLWWVQSFSYTLGILLILMLILTFLYRLATGNEILFIKTNMMFWICLGLFVFYFCSLPFFGMGNYLFTRYGNIYIWYAYAIYVLNYIMYSLFIIAFIWGKPKLSYL